MDKTMVISLSGHAEQFRLDAASYERLERYLDRAASRLRDDPDRVEILKDLEGSIGDKLGARLGSDDRIVSTSDVDGILEQIGAVDTGDERAADEAVAAPGSAPRRRLTRIRDGQQIAGVCMGIAEYAELRVDWVRTGFVLGTLLTAGLLALVYVALAIILPVAATREA